MNKHSLVMALVAIIPMLNSAVALAAGGKGVTWGKSGHDNALGMDIVSCHGSPPAPGGGSCNAYIGDTSCSTALPVLCIKVDGSPRPNYAVNPNGAAMTGEYYQGWAGRHIATTEPIIGSQLTSAAVADQVCSNTFGAGWRMAEHHDGKWLYGMGLRSKYGNTANWHSSSPWTSGYEGGWTIRVYGNVRNDMRYWVKVIGQPAHCWN